MLVKYSVLAQASGSAGGYTFSRNRSGAYLRNRSVPTNPGSADQQTVRGIFAGLSSAWSAITAAQRAAWALYASNVPVTNRLGEQIFLTGQQMFVRNNAVRLRLGLSQISDGPTIMAGASLTLPSADISVPSGVDVVFTEADAWALTTGGALGIYVSTDKGVAVEYHKGPYLLAGAILGNTATPPTSPDSSLSSPYVHATGNSVFYRFVACLADGRISPVMRQGPTTVPA